jgi:predicted amino acid racemase
MIPVFCPECGEVHKITLSDPPASLKVKERKIMKIKAKDLQVGQLFKQFSFSTVYSQVASVQEFDGAVIVGLAGEETNPFVSSQFASYSLTQEVEVL